MAFKSDRQQLSITILSLLLAVLFLGAGLPKLLSVEVIVAHRELWGFSPWISYTTGTIEVLGGVFLMIPVTRFYAATGLACMMALGPFSHVRQGELVSQCLPSS